MFKSKSKSESLTTESKSKSAKNRTRVRLEAKSRTRVLQLCLIPNCSDTKLPHHHLSTHTDLTLTVYTKVV